MILFPQGKPVAVEGLGEHLAREGMEPCGETFPLLRFSMKLRLPDCEAAAGQAFLWRANGVSPPKLLQTFAMSFATAARTNRAASRTASFWSTALTWCWKESFSLV